MLYQARKKQISHPMVILSGVLDENLIEMQKEITIFFQFFVYLCLYYLDGQDIEFGLSL